MELLVAMIFWLVCSVVVGGVAGRKHRSILGWFALSLLISPLLAGVLLAGLSVADADPQAAAFAAADSPRPETHTRCPDCRELVRKDARKCKHCGSALAPR